MARPATLIVIPALNEVAGIRDVIHRLLADALPTDPPVRLVVADGGSTDGTQDVVRALAAQDPRVLLLHNSKRIQSAAVNLAVEQHGEACDVLVRCDAHAAYPARYVARLRAALDQHDADAVVVPMDSVGRTCLQRAVAWASDSPVGSGGSAHRGGHRSGFVDHGHHAAFRMASFRRAGGYDESFTHNEDAELDCRQRALGSRIYLDAAIRLQYTPRATLGSLARQYFNYGKGRSRTIRRHPESLRLRQLAVPLHMALCVLALLLSPWSPALLVWPALYGLALVGASVALAVKHRSACGLMGGVAAGVMHSAWAAGFVQGLLVLRESRWVPPSENPAASGDGSTRIAYFVHHAEDPAYRRRISMFQAGGASVEAFGFSRDRPTPHAIAGARFHPLGTTQAANFVGRVKSVLLAAMGSGAWRAAAAQADVIVARNLECLALAVLAGRWAAPGTPIHYEVLDIHRLMPRQDVVGRTLRAVEAWLMRRCDGLLISSPAFETHYFRRFHRHVPPTVLVENKVFPAPTSDGPVATGFRASSAASSRLRLGWFGVLRCRKSLLMLRELVRRHPGQFEVTIRGQIAETAIPDFHDLIRDEPDLRFLGPYRNPDDLAAMYGAVDLVWAIDFFEEGQNSVWLLPNRLYEGCLFGAVPLALAGTETANWLQSRQLGIVAGAWSVDVLSEALLGLSVAQRAELRAAVQARLPTDFACDAASCRALVARLCESAALPASQPQAIQARR